MDQTSATVVEWLKNEGDFVKIDDAVLVVETEKVATEVTAPASGILAGIRVVQGDEVPVTEVIAYILAEDETVADIPKVETATIERSAPAGELPHLATTPIAARMARELGIDLGEIKTTGDRITKADIIRHAAAVQPSEAGGRIAATPAARRLARELGLELDQITGRGPRGRVQEADVSSFGQVTGTRLLVDDREYTIKSLTSMRRTIAERMQTSFQTAPHITLSIDVDVQQFERERARINAIRNQRDDKAISMTAALVFVTARVLSDHPFVNASYLDDQIYLWKDVNIGVATAVEEGLVVPVIHQAGELSIDEINRMLRDLVDRARSGKLSLSDVRGGSFTISNLGMFGIHRFQAIINPPESAILAIGSIVRKPVVVNDEDDIEVRPMMNLSLSADHRVLDGVSAARFLSDLAQNILNPVPHLE